MKGCLHGLSGAGSRLLLQSGMKLGRHTGRENKGSTCVLLNVRVSHMCLRLSSCILLLELADSFEALEIFVVE